MSTGSDVGTVIGSVLGGLCTIVTFGACAPAAPLLGMAGGLAGAGIGAATASHGESSKDAQNRVNALVMKQKYEEAAKLAETDKNVPNGAGQAASLRKLIPKAGTPAQRRGVTAGVLHPEHPPLFQRVRGLQPTGRAPRLKPPSTHAAHSADAFTPWYARPHSVEAANARPCDGSPACRAEHIRAAAHRHKRVMDAVDPAGTHSVAQSAEALARQPRRRARNPPRTLPGGGVAPPPPAPQTQGPDAGAAIAGGVAKAVGSEVASTVGDVALDVLDSIF